MRSVELDWFLRPVLDDAADGVLVECRETVRYINDAYARVLGYRARDLVGATIHEIAEPDDEPRLRRFGERRQQGLPAPSRYVFRARRRDASIVWLDASISSTRLGKDFFIATFVREVRSFDRAAIPSVEGLKKLSPREYEILMQTLRGFRPKDIAMLLEISEKTVATHRARIFHKLSLRGDADLFRFAADHELFESRPVHSIVPPEAHPKASLADERRLVMNDPRVLIVDDDATIRRNVAVVLRRAGFAVDTASGRKKAIKQLTAKQYAAVVLDLASPELGGREIVEQLSKTASDTRCVVLISDETEPRPLNVPEQLIHATLRKPFDIADIVAAVKECVESAPPIR